VQLIALRHKFAGRRLDNFAYLKQQMNSPILTPPPFAKRELQTRY